MLLAGKPVIMHILDRVDRIGQIEKVVIVCVPQYRSALELMLQQYGISTPVDFAPAGETRQASVLSGLRCVQTADVLIHEAARPFVKVEDFNRLIDEPGRNATFGTDIPFTVVRGHSTVESLLTRSELVNVQLPQKFETQLLLSAHEKAVQDDLLFTEDASLVFHYFPQTQIRICPGMDYNIKITTRIDMLAGEIIYEDVFSKRD